jgi:hypothetical protein
MQAAQHAPGVGPGVVVLDEIVRHAVFRERPAIVRLGEKPSVVSEDPGFDHEKPGKICWSDPHLRLLLGVLPVFRRSSDRMSGRPGLGGL